MLNFNITEEDVKSFVKVRFSKNYDGDLFERIWNVYKSLPAFKINENWIEVEPELLNYEYLNELHNIVKLTTQYFMRKTFQAMKVDLDDPNVAEDLITGNIGSFGRVAKMMTGSNTHDDRELMGGRFHMPVRLAKFPNTSDKKLPIIKEVDLMAVCSHHLAPFGTLVGPKAKVIVAYIPDKFVLGISKLQRVVRYISQRGWLQEDLTKVIYDEISKVADTKSVYVKLKNIEHTCEKYRGAVTQSQGFTTEYYGGLFDTDQQLLNSVKD